MTEKELKLIADIINALDTVSFYGDVSQQYIDNLRKDFDAVALENEIRDKSRQLRASNE